MVYEPIEMVNGILSALMILISWGVSIKISYKYFILKESAFLYLGLSWFGITSPWWGSTLSFITYLIFGTGISLELYLLSTITFVPIFLVFFLKAFIELMWEKYRKIILIFFSVEGIIFEIFYIYFILVDPQFLGVLESIIDIRFKGFVMIYLITIILILLCSGVLFGIFSLKSKNPEVKIQGKFLIAAFISFSIGGFLDSSIPLNFITLALSRIILISSSIEFYLGFIFPKFLRKFCTPKVKE